MIKRYGFGQKSIRVSGNTSVNIPDLVERDDGDYVRYEDYAVAMESTQKTLEQHRVEFESFYKTTLDPDEKVTFALDFRVDQYINTFIEHAWQVWLAAKGVKE